MHQRVRVRMNANTGSSASAGVSERTAILLSPASLDSNMLSVFCSLTDNARRSRAVISIVQTRLRVVRRRCVRT